MTNLGNRIKEKREEIGMTQMDLARAAGISQPSLSDIESGVIVAPRKWQKLADALSIPHGEFMDLMRSTVKTARMKRPPRSVQTDNKTDYNARIGATLPPTSGNKVPVYGRAAGGTDGKYHFNGEAIDWVMCPPVLNGVPGAYAIYVDGESMSPRYRPGETVWAHPSRPAKRGNDVIVQLHPDKTEDVPYGFVKELVRVTPTMVVVRQYNPAVEIEFARKAVKSIHPIVFAER